MGLLSRASKIQKELASNAATSSTSTVNLPGENKRIEHDSKNIVRDSPRGLLARANSFLKEKGRRVIADVKKNGGGLLKKASLFKSQESSKPAHSSLKSTSNFEEKADSIFNSWELKAEEELQRQTSRKASVSERDQPVHLFEGEDYSTTPVETHIASQRKIDNYLALFDISKELSAIDTVEKLWDCILYSAMGQLGAESVCIFSAKHARSDSIFYPAAQTGVEPNSGWALRPGDKIYKEMKTTDGVRYAKEFLESKSSPLSSVEKSIIENSGAHLISALKSMKDYYGVLFIGPQVNGDEYSVDDIEFLNRLSEIAAVAIEHVLSHSEFEEFNQKLRRENDMHNRIFSVVRNVSGMKTLDALFDTLAAHLKEDFNVESFSVILLNQREHIYKIFGGNQISPASMEKFKLNVSSELIGLISNLVRVYELQDFRDNREITTNYTNEDLALMQSYWIVPLISLNWLVGFITVHKTTEPWDESHRNLIVSSAEVLAPVFANAIILGERETLFRDPFSPLEGRLKKELIKAMEFQVSVSLAEIRVKNLKRLAALNSPEHLTTFLTDLGRSISGYLFESDFLSRVGQGRFAIILPGRTKDEALEFVKKIKTELKRKRMLPGSPIDVQYLYNIISSPADTDDPGKMLSLFE